MAQATHRGNCQSCGRQHHYMGAIHGLAKHGYTVEFGYFNGVCGGSGKAPMQLDRTITDSTIAGLNEYAAGQDALAEEYLARSTVPARIKTGDKYSTQTYKYEPVYIRWDEGTDAQKDRAIELAAWDCESAARGARSFARDLGKLVNELHGTPLVEIIEPAKVEKPVATVDVKAGKVFGAFGSKAARKQALEDLNRRYEKISRRLNQFVIDTPHEKRTPAHNAAYDIPYSTLAHWRPKHRTAVLAVFPDAVALLDEIDELVKAREAVKAAP